MKYKNFTLGEIEAMINKLGGIDGVKKFLRGELIVSEPARSWREENGIIYFSVTSDGTNGKQWIARLRNKGVDMGSGAKNALRSKSFKPTSGVTYEIVVLTGRLFSNNKRIIKNIREEANNRKLSTPNTEVVCLIREKFSDKELEAMGLFWIIVMHEPIKDSNGDPGLLYITCNNTGPWMNIYSDNPDAIRDCNSGWAFVESQLSNS